jgi:hypothetical protein
MVTTCGRCGRVIEVPSGGSEPIMTTLVCKCCGHEKLGFRGLPSLLEPMVVHQRRAYPWLPEFPPKRR